MLKYAASVTTLAALFCHPTLQAQRPVPTGYTGPVNYVRTWEAVAPTQDAGTLNTATTVDKARMTTEYLDGLGRPVQTVSKAALPGSKDLVAPVEYDAFGRVQHSYLPYAAPQSDGAFKVNPFQDQKSFFESPASPITGQGESFYYSHTQYEASPLNRVDKTLAPGNSWVGSGRGVRTEYGVNGDEQVLRVWEIAYASGSLPTSNRHYPAGSLHRTRTDDEHGGISFEFKDKQGRVICKSMRNGQQWLMTIYVYDDFGRLRFVIPPKAFAELPDYNSVPQTIADELCFRYEYDERGRMIVKKVPGAGEVWMVYDKRDRLVMTQDANMRPNHMWLYTTYDELNRPVSTGVVAAHSNRGDHAYQASIQPTYPTLNNNFDEHTRTFYDSYDWLGPNGNPFSNQRNSWDDGQFQPASNTTYPYPQAMQQSNALTGMVTGTMTKVLGTSQKLYSINFYDERGRVIQTQRLSVDGYHVVSTQYTFAGQVYAQYDLVGHAPGNKAQGVFTQNSFDAGGRITEVKKHLVTSYPANNGQQRTVSRLDYDALGQLKTKKLAPYHNNNQGLETLTYDYNIRGWLLGANRDYVRDQPSPQPGGAGRGPYFGFDLGYDKANNNLIGGTQYTNPQYNGNIAGTVWKSKGDGEKRKYDFTYDEVNRLTSADFNQFSGGSFNKSAGVDFGVTNLAYDLNGNIKTMHQRGLQLTGSNPIDQLDYTYQPASNKLQRVWDFANDKDSKLGDFKFDPNDKATGIDYDYDANGNLIKDANKKITAISYNHLNLPEQIQVAGKGTITYTYDAGGNKLKKVVQEQGQPAKTTLYLGGAVYENDVLQFIGMEEGRIRWKPLDNSFQFDYMLKDHLGNVRMVLTEEQRQDAYPAATMETAQATTEEALYTNLPNTRSDKPAGYPNDTYTSPNDKVAKVRGDGQKIGPGIVLKVMAGDAFNFRVNSWYKTYGQGHQPPVSAAQSVVDALNSSLPGASGGKFSPPQLATGGNLLLQAVDFFMGNQRTNTPADRPKAFVSWILFDENLKYEYSSSGFEQVGANEQFTTHVRNNLPVAKSGYLYLYVSNETPNLDVFFDNLQVSHIRGPMLEETHYYPFGLTMAGISSKAAGGVENKKKYNDGTELESKEFSDGSGLDLYATEFRSYDAQIGRFHQIDPLAEITDSWSPYSYANNNPVLLNDPLGLTADSVGLPEVTVVNFPSRKPAPPPLPTLSPTPIPEIVPGSGTPTPPSNGANGAVLAGAVAVGTRANPVGAAVTTTVGLGYILYYWYTHPVQPTTPAIPFNWSAPRDHTNHVPPPLVLRAEDKTDHLKGGGQNKRDADIKQYPIDFQRWYHRGYKKPGDPNATKEELKELYEEWESMGKPKVK